MFDKLNRNVLSLFQDEQTWSFFKIFCFYLGKQGTIKSMKTDNQTWI